MKYVLLYTAAADVAAKAPAHFPAHSARAQQFHATGDLLMIGVFTDVQSDGAMAVFTTREAAEEFARADPFVTEGVVQEWRVLEWRESLAP